MALAAKLQMRQSQSLVMTPQLLQSIRLLQFTQVELERFIDEEIERNPLLERASQSETAGDSKVDAASEGQEGIALAEGGDEPGPENWSAEDIASRLDTSLDNVFPDDPGRADRIGPELTANWKSGPGAGSGEAFDIEDIADRRRTLREHVGEQIIFAFPDPALSLIAAELGDWLDDAGYFRGDLEEIAGRLGVDQEVVAATLDRCRRFEPPGLFARDLADCLALQLQARDRFDPAMAALVAHLDLLARRDFASLRRITGVDDGDLLDMLAEIKALDPKPGAAFEGGGAEPIIADVLVRVAADGSWEIELNPQALPRVIVDQSYYLRVSGASRSQPDREFLTECLQSANWLTRSLDQRARTIMKVTAEIVRQQDGFLTHGVQHLRPLNLKTVAEAIGMHESTVSRVTANKYMLTPRGVFELRYFFTGALASAEGGEAFSTEAVRHRIRSLIDDERPAEVLSDDALADMLKRAGVDIARRTVAKYREGMSIPSSVQRRREKMALAASSGGNAHAASA